VKNSLFAFLLLNLITTGIVHAQDENVFGNIEIDLEDSGSNQTGFSVLGWVAEKAAYGLEVPDPLFSRTDTEANKLESSLFLQVDIDLDSKSQFRLSGKYYRDEVFRLNEDTPYSRDERDLFRNRAELRDFYVDRQFENGMYLKFGNQIVAWGLSEFLRVTDLVNFEDQYAFGQLDLQDIRIQVPAALFSFSLGEWTFNNVVTHRAGRNFVAPAGDEFDQWIALRDQDLSLNRHRPEDEFEYFFRATTQYRRGDLQIVAADLNENNLTVSSITGLRSINPIVNFSQNRMQALGVAANFVSGPWVLFGEAGIHKNRTVRPNNESFFRQINGWDQKDQVLNVLGVEYDGFSNTLLSLEIDNVHTNDHDQFMQARKNQLSAGARLYWTGFNERLSVLGVVNQLANNAGRFGRLSIDYNWSDNLDLGLMWVDYHSSEGSVLHNFRNNDVVQLQLRFSFQN